MGDWPAQAERVGLGITVISPAHELALGGGLKAAMGDGALTTSTAWPAANRAILIPFRLPRRVTLYQAVVGSGATATGNFDVGVYQPDGKRVISAGSTAKGNSVETVVNLTDTLIGPGFYYMALSASTTNNFIASTVANAGIAKNLGIRQASSAFALPDPITFETAASNIIPAFSMWFKSN